jgi:hypothetical protein
VNNDAGHLAVLALAGVVLAGSGRLAAQTPQAAPADGPATTVRTEYLMTLYAPLEASSDIDSSLFVYNIAAGGWARGPRIKARLVPPGADWMRVLPSGAMRIDVRATLKTDDGALIYVSYNGVLRESKANEEQAARGAVLTHADIEYFVTAPTFETSAPKYAWLNGLQAIGKMVEMKDGKGGYVKYDLFAVY